MKIIFEIDIDDLPSFRADASEPGGGLQNICSFLHDQLICGTLEKHMHYMANCSDEIGSPMYEATRRLYKEEEELARRMLDKLRIEL